MSAVTKAALTLTLSPEEAEELLRVLEATAAAKRVETRRTDARDYREKVAHEEEMLSALVTRVRALVPPESAGP
jgi:hypothetical protein